MNRRDLVKLTAGAVVAGGTPPLVLGAALAQGTSPVAGAVSAKPAPFVLPALGYAPDALEPHIDATTMRIHHGTHHAGYVRNLNLLAEKYPPIATAPMERTLASIGNLPVAIRDGVRNNMGGHWNHSFFWDLMTPGGPKAPTGALNDAIISAFGSVPAMQEAMNAAALSRFGSGWAWVGVGRDRKLTVFSTPYQDTPQMIAGVRGAVLGVDVWEHAYYLKHQASRANYLKAWWNTVNWDKSSARFTAASR